MVGRAAGAVPWSAACGGMGIAVGTGGVAGAGRVFAVLGDGVVAGPGGLVGVCGLACAGAGAGAVTSDEVVGRFAAAAAAAARVVGAGTVPGTGATGSAVADVGGAVGVTGAPGADGADGAGGVAGCSVCAAGGVRDTAYPGMVGQSSSSWSCGVRGTCSTRSGVSGGLVFPRRRGPPP